MLSLSHHPRPPLSEFVDCLWLVEGGQTPRLERILPSGTIEVVINLRDDEVHIHDAAQPDRYKRFSGAVVSGTYSSVFICDAMQHEAMLGVHFKPGGAFPFLGALASELTNTHADLADLWGQSALQLRERLCTQTTPQERFRIMEEVLNDRLRRSQSVVSKYKSPWTCLGRRVGAPKLEMSPKRLASASGSSSRCSKLRSD